jgi:hypothetical protein
MTTRGWAALLILSANAGCLGDPRTKDGPDPDPDPEPVACEAVEPRPGAPVVINEVMASNALTLVDEGPASPDWIEIYNPTGDEVSLCGYSLTDDLGEPRKAEIGLDVAVPAGGHVVVRFGGGPAGTLSVPFALTQDGGDIGLSGPDGEYLDRVVYGAQATDLSAAREPDGSDLWVIEWHASPGQPNPEGAGSPAGPEDAASSPERIPETGDLTEEILGYDVLLELGIEVEPEHVTSLEIDPYTYVPGHLVYQGRRYGPVGVRLKGQNSFQPFSMKPSFRINIDEYVEGAKFFQLDDMTINNMNDDFSMMHERLAYWVARQLGPASRANHAVLTVNGEHYGLYTNVETVKWHMVARWFDDPTGPLFEATDVDFVASYIPVYEHESGPDDRSMLVATAEALLAADADEAIATVGGYVEMSEFLGYWAMAAVIGQFDAFPYSDPGDDYFVYADPGTDRLWFMPWGMDETFYSGSYDVTMVRSVLATRCLESSSCRQAFIDRVWAGLAQLEAADWEAQIDRVAAQIAPHVAADRNKPYTDATVAEYQTHLGFFIGERRASLSTMIPPPGSSSPQGRSSQLGTGLP